jgi:hypothetical protein
MTTTTARRDILAQVALDIRRCSEAEARVKHQAGDWRADALERAGELALGGYLVKSRKAAEQAREQ